MYRSPVFGVTVLSAVALVGCLELVDATDAAGQAQAKGVKHRLNASIAVDRDPRKPANGYVATDRATLVVTVRISDEAQESRFFSDVRATFADFALNEGSSEQTIWEDKSCHHERGFPKAVLVAVDGSVTNGKTPAPISARHRRIGLPIPADEVTMGRRLPSGTDGIGSFMASRAETTASRLVVQLKLYTLECAL